MTNHSSTIRSDGNAYDEIQQLRLSIHLSQVKLAEYAGFSPAKISSWELHKSIPSDEQLRRLRDTLATLIHEIKSNKLNIRKKRIVRDDVSPKGALAPVLRSAEEYDQRMENARRPDSSYTTILSSIYSLAKRSRTNDAPKTISLFSGCGGLDLGFLAAGFDIKGHLELDEEIEAIYAANFPSSKKLGNDICKITDNDINAWKRQFGAIDIVIGGPPCQGFSLAGKRNPHDIRNQLYKNYAHILSLLKPRVFVLENVLLMTSMKDVDGQLVFHRVLKTFDEIGYAVFHFAINACEYGVPQSRERLIVVGVRKDCSRVPFTLPSPTHSQFSSVEPLLFQPDSLPKARTFRDATGDLQVLESGELSSDPLHWAVQHPAHVLGWLRPVPEGHSAHENTDPKLRPPSGFNTTYKRNCWNEPCSTISTNFGMISGCRNVHPTSTRALTIREAARVQSFPDQFRFFGSWTTVRKAIGNAVPPLLAMVIAQAVRNRVFGQTTHTPTEG